MPRNEDEKVALFFGGGLTLLIHVVMAVVFATTTSVAELGAMVMPVQRRLCGEVRCPERARAARRRLMDPVLAEVGVIEASVLPRLGLAKPNPMKFPKLTKYEQPEKIQEAVNITREVKKPGRPPPMAERHKRAELDRRRKEKPTLASILGAPEDEDPRKRPTALDRIIGRPDGSPLGASDRELEGNLYAARVAAEIRKVFVVPPYLGKAEMARLKVRIKVERLSEKGEILEFKVVAVSGNKAFDAAALRAVKMFVPQQGGRGRLPPPDPETLALVNARGMLVDLDGALFGK